MIISIAVTAAILFVIAVVLAVKNCIMKRRMDRMSRLENGEENKMTSTIFITIRLCGLLEYLHILMHKHCTSKAYIIQSMKVLIIAKM